ncbi:type II secretion system F family protein [Lichenicoccus roseus]|uniref:Type II secretion system protein F n=1 Tax=Lichenicoccus roseus TaxID=2683649 RepID=A0A5R9J021_9PROT|nr:type II secretion system F family protein [Lichenicoccus roseus]TLU70872.1 type II secretion system protein F [Lichenicoccus roseus]
MNAYLLPLAFLLLSVVGICLFLLNQQRERRRRLKRRFSKALDPYAKRRRDDPGAAVSARISTDAPAATAADRYPRIFGFNAARLDLYPARPLILIGIASIIGCLADWMLRMIVGWIALPALPFLCIMFSRLLFGRFHQRRADTLFKQFPDALAMIVRAVRVGIPISEAVRAVARENEAPTAVEFARLADQMAIGLPLDEALRGMAERNGLPEYRFFATALTLQGQTGGNLSETLDNLADVIRKRVAARARGYALAAEARTSANVLSALPVLLFIALMFMNPAYADQLLDTHSGHVILGLTLLLLGGGMFVMRLLIQKSLS